MIMKYIPTIVIDDDNPEVLRNFRLRGRQEEVHVVPFTTWDKTKEYIEGGNVVDGIVLDARGLLTADSSEGEEHLFESYGYVKGKQIPYAIYTAYTDSIPALKQQIAEGRVFTKGRNKVEDVFAFLKEEIEKMPIVQLKNKYGAAFAPFQLELIDISYEHNLIDLLLCLEGEDFRKKNLNLNRDILEAIFLCFIERHHIMPNTFLNNRGRPNLEWSTRFLEGRPTNCSLGISHTIENDPPDEIKRTIRFVKEISSCYSHLSEHENVKNAFVSATYSTLEILEWIPSYISN